MKVSLRLFAGARQAAGSELVTLELADGASVAEMRRALIERYPAMSALSPHLRFAVNARYASEDEVLGVDDEVACIPPVSGG